MINLDNLKFTKESIYSITPWREADQISKKIIKYISKPVDDIIITDATANVGGNTISFYNQGIKTVNSVEIDSKTCEILKNNLNVYNYTTENVICGDYLKIKDELIQDCVFIDPPWGGKNYTNKKILDLYLGRTEVTDIIFDLFVENKTKLVVLKAPINYNYHSIELILKMIFISNERKNN
jgi:predicted RNA methylase